MGLGEPALVGPPVGAAAGSLQLVGEHHEVSADLRFSKRGWGGQAGAAREHTDACISKRSEGFARPCTYRYSTQSGKVS